MAPAVTAIVLHPSHPLHFALSKPAGLFKFVRMIVLVRALKFFEQLIADMLHAEAFLSGVPRPRLIGRLTVTPVAWIGSVFAQRCDAAPFNFEPAIAVVFAQNPALAHFADVALETFVTYEFAGIEAGRREREFALLLWAKCQLLPRVPDLGQHAVLLAKLTYQFLVAPAQLPYPFSDQALLCRFPKPTIDLLLPTLGGFQFERRLSLLTTELPVMREAANGMPRPLDETAVIAGLGSIILELSLGPGMLAPGLFELAFGAFERQPADRCAGSLVKLVLRDFSVIEQLAGRVPQGFASASHPVPVLCRPP